MSKKGVNRWIVLFVLALTCGLIYQLPYLRYSYYDQMIAAFAVTNVQLGTFMTAYGLGSLPCYILGGIFAMKFSDKALLPAGTILTGAAGLWFATFPSYGATLFIHFFWAFSTSLIFWPAAINFVRGLGNSSEQGRLYGLFEGMRGICATVIGLGIVALFNAAMSELAGLRTVILTYSAINIGLGVILFFFVPNNKEEKKALAVAAGQSSLLKGFGAALKMPITWAATGIVFFTMMVFDCLGYTTPYLTGCLGATAAFAAAFGTIRTWGLQFVGGTTGGIIADKIGSSAKTLIGGFAIIVIGFVILNLLPVKSSMVWPAAIFILIFGTAPLCQPRCILRRSGRSPCSRQHQRRCGRYRFRHRLHSRCLYLHHHRLLPRYLSRHPRLPDHLLDGCGLRSRRPDLRSHCRSYHQKGQSPGGGRIISLYITSKAPLLIVTRGAFTYRYLSSRVSVCESLFVCEIYGKTAFVSLPQTRETPIKVLSLRGRIIPSSETVKTGQLFPWRKCRPFYGRKERCGVRTVPFCPESL